MRANTNNTPALSHDKNYYAIITAIYNEIEYVSIPILLVDESADESIISVNYLTQYGTSNLTMFKLPISDSEYIIFSREQLDQSLFKVQILDEAATNLILKNSKKRVKRTSTK